MSNKNFYDTEQWKRKRAVVLRRDKYIDQQEKRYGKLREATHVHHVFPLDEFPEYRLTDWNLISVSMATHNKLHDRITNELTDAGIDLLRRIARRHNVTVPDKYK